MNAMITKDAETTVSNLRRQGIKFNIISKVERKVELHHCFTMLNGKEKVRFVAEIDSFGNIVEWGSGFRKLGKKALKTYNADGEEV